MSDLNRIKYILVKQGQTGKWLADLANHLHLVRLVNGIEIPFTTYRQTLKENRGTANSICKYLLNKIEQKN